MVLGNSGESASKGSGSARALGVQGGEKLISTETRRAFLAGEGIKYDTLLFSQHRKKETFELFHGSR